jgi:hypothetical protein
MRGKKAVGSAVEKATPSQNMDTGSSEAHHCEGQEGTAIFPAPLMLLVSSTAREDAVPAWPGLCAGADRTVCVHSGRRYLLKAAQGSKEKRE